METLSELASRRAALERRLSGIAMKKPFHPGWLRFVFLGLVMLQAAGLQAKDLTLLNVSYDPTREFFEEINRQFTVAWKGGETLKLRQSHGGSGKQARAVIDGLQADVVTLALGYDIEAIASKSGLIATNWQERLPNNSCPFTSTIVLVVRQGNPKNIKDWDDLARTGIGVVSPNPKTSGGARWNFLAAYGSGLRHGGPDAARELVRKIFANVRVLDTGARGSTITFIQRGVGDVLIAWENEAILAAETMAKGKVEIVYPSSSILAEPPVAVVDANARRHGTEQAALDYLKFLYTPSAQELAAKHHFRPSDPAVRAKYAAKFPALKLFTVSETFGTWQKAHQAHFGPGGTMDQILVKK